MAQLQCSTTVNAPVDQVFSTYSDFPNAANNVEGIVRVEILTEGPVGKGTRFKETRVMFGKETTEEMEVIAFEPNRSYTIAAESCGAYFQSKFTFSDEGETTMVQMDMETKALTFFAKLMSPMSILMMGSMKKMIQADIDQVKTVCEKNASV